MKHAGAGGGGGGRPLSLRSTMGGGGGRAPVSLRSTMTVINGLLRAELQHFCAVTGNLTD